MWKADARAVFIQRPHTQLWAGDKNISNINLCSHVGAIFISHTHLRRSRHLCSIFYISKAMYKVLLVVKRFLKQGGEKTLSSYLFFLVSFSFSEEEEAEL